MIEGSLLQIFIKKEFNQPAYSQYFKLKGGHTDSINDVAWAPLAGRSFHIIVSCSKDQYIIVWKIVTKDFLDQGKMLEIPQVEQLCKLNEGRAEVQRLNWNLLGTTFASSADDGTVKVWKKSVKNKF